MRLLIALSALFVAVMSTDAKFSDANSWANKVPEITTHVDDCAVHIERNIQLQRKLNALSEEYDNLATKYKADYEKLGQLIGRLEKESC